MRPRLLRNRQRILAASVGPATGTSPEQASQSTSVVKYPGGLDTGPTITDDATPLASQWYNFLGLMVEAVMAEIGPIGRGARNVVGDSTSLQRFLGVTGAARLSLYRSVTKTEAGQIFGIIKKHVSGTVTYANGEQTTTVSNDHGADPFVRNPVCFAIANQHGPSASEMTTGPVNMRAYTLNNSSATTITLKYRACAPAGGNPSGSGTHSADILVFFVPTTN